MADLFRMEIMAGVDDADVLTGLLSGLVKHGWEEEDTPQGVLFRIHSERPEFGQELESELLKILPLLRISHSIVPDVDWVSSWKDFFTPVEAGSRFIVLPPWLEEERRATSRTPVIIEPKTAFGTGHHATTALCLGALSDLADAGAVKAGQSFLDLGTGSGILGIGAALLGLSGLGVDLDMLAVNNALENREINGVTPENFEVRRGSMEAVSGGPFDLVLANILAEPLINLAAPLCAVLKDGASLVLSGILTIQADTVEAAYMACGLPVARRRSMDEWTCLIWENIILRG